MIVALTPLTRPLVIAALGACVVAGVGAAMTDLSPWYFALAQPSWKPPDWLFGPAWTIIFALCAVAAARGWIAFKEPSKRSRLLLLFGLNAILNIAWTTLFFRLQRPDWALIQVGVLWLSVLALIVALAPRAPVASWMLAPYLVWVSFAGLLNFEVVRLNPSFAAS